MDRRRAEGRAGVVVTADDLRGQVRDFLAAHDPASMDRLDFLRARFDAGLAWVHYPSGLGGQGLSRDLQPAVDAEFAAVGAPTNHPERNGIGLGMAAPTILAYGSAEQQQRWLRPLWTGEEIWCQLFSEPGAGSDLAGLSARATQEGDTWCARGQKDEYIGTLVNAYLAQGGRAVGVHAGQAYVDVGTVHGYREAIKVLGVAYERV